MPKYDFDEKRGFKLEELRKHTNEEIIAISVMCEKYKDHLITDKDEIDRIISKHPSYMTAWTENHVLVQISYDGGYAEWWEFIPRHPINETVMVNAG